MVCLGNEQRSFCHFWDCFQYYISGSFVDYDGYSISSKRFLPTVVNKMVIWVKFTHSSPFWRRQWHPTPVLLPGKSHGWRSLVGYNPWGRWVGHDWAISLSLFTFMHWRRKWQPTPVFLPGESQGQRSLVGFRLWGCTELDTTDVT